MFSFDDTQFHRRKVKDDRSLLQTVLSTSGEDPQIGITLNRVEVILNRIKQEILYDMNCSPVNNDEPQIVDRRAS